MPGPEPGLDQFDQPVYPLLWQIHRQGLITILVPKFE